MPIYLEGQGSESLKKENDVKLKSQAQKIKGKNDKHLQIFINNRTAV